jgi:hypothetical protein
MRKLSTMTIMIAVLIGFGSIAYALADSTETGNQQDAMMVKNPEGEFVGTVTNALVDPSGNLAFIILSVDGKTGQEKKEIAVPVGTFAYDRENRVVVMDVDREKLSLAPEFVLSDLNHPTFAENVYRFFGLMPSWTEGEGED